MLSFHWFGIHFCVETNDSSYKQRSNDLPFVVMVMAKVGFKKHGYN